MRFLFLISILFFDNPLFSQNNFVIYTLGIAQDAGFPQAGCTKDCCKESWKYPEKRKMATCLAIVDTVEKKWWMVEATPDFKNQLYLFNQLTKNKYAYLPNGIFITHAHMGHYTGLLQLGRETMNSNKIPVYVLPKLKHYLETNGPWSQLVSLKNIELIELTDKSLKFISNGFDVMAFTVPHRDEFSETAGFNFMLNNKKVVFIPDIDKWQKHSKDVSFIFTDCTLAFIDGTFYKDGELEGRSMKEVPHPFVKESMDLFKHWQSALKSKIYFIHFNHTNPLLKINSKERNEVLLNNFKIAKEAVLYSTY